MKYKVEEQILNDGSKKYFTRYKEWLWWKPIELGSFGSVIYYHSREDALYSIERHYNRQIKSKKVEIITR